MTMLAVVPHPPPATGLAARLDRMGLIVVHPHGRAGSIFLQSLFDGHPEVTTLPHFGPLYRHVPDVFPDPLPHLDGLIERSPHLFDSALGYFGKGTHTVAGAFGENFDQHLRVDAAAFRVSAERLFEELGAGGVSRPRFFLAVHLAYAECVRGSHAGIRYVLYHPHTYAEMDALIAGFPSLRFIAMTRDPRQDWESWRRVVALRARAPLVDVSPVFMAKSTATYASDVGQLRATTERLGAGRVRIIDLAELHRRSDVAMRDLCVWLGIQYDACLTASTFNGEAWAGNSADRRVQSGFSPEMARERWRETLPAEQIDFVSSTLEGAIRWLRYEAAGPRLDPVAYLQQRSTFRGTARYVAQQLRIDAGDRLARRSADSWKQRAGRAREGVIALSAICRDELRRCSRGHYIDAVRHAVSDQREYVGPARGDFFLDGRR